MTMSQPGKRDRYWRDLRPWSDPLIKAPPADDPYPVSPPEEEPVVAEMVDPSPPKPTVEPFDDSDYPPPPWHDETASFRFSLMELMLLMTTAAALFALMGRLPRPLFAGVAGGLALLMLGVLSFIEVRHPLLNVGWWLLFAVYLVASLTAALPG